MQNVKVYSVYVHLLLDFYIQALFASPFMIIYSLYEVSRANKEFFNLQTKMFAISPAHNSQEHIDNIIFV